MNPRPSNPEAPRRVPPVISCLVKGPLGCLAFVLGATLVVVLFLPPVGGRLADRALERWFAQHHAGTLELGDSWFGSLYGEQRVESLILRDPEQEEVLRAALRGPSLATVFEGRASYGPVVVRVPSLRLQLGRDGRSNLARALAERETSRASARSALSSESPFTITLEVRIERLRYTGLGGVEGSLDGITLRGELVLDASETRLWLEGGPDPVAGAPGPAPRARLEFAHLNRAADESWRSTIAFEGLPPALVGTLCAEFGPLAPFCGPTLERLDRAHDGRGVVLRAEDEGAVFALEQSDGRPPGQPGAQGSAQLSLPAGDARASALLTRLLPLVEALAPASGEASAQARTELRLSQARWPTRQRWDELEGELSLSLAPLRAGLAPEARAAWGTAPAVLELGGPRLLGLVRAGVLEYAPFRMELGGGWLEFTGTQALGAGELALRLAGERAGVPLETLHLVGQRGALVAAPPAPPVPELAPPQPPRER